MLLLCCQVAVARCRASLVGHAVWYELLLPLLQHVCTEASSISGLRLNARLAGVAAPGHGILIARLVVSVNIRWGSTMGEPEFSHYVCLPCLDEHARQQGVVLQEFGALHAQDQGSAQ
jgi:hypothetical protein